MFTEEGGALFPTQLLLAAVPGTDRPSLQGGVGSHWLFHSHLPAWCSTHVSSSVSDTETLPLYAIKSAPLKTERSQAVLFFIYDNCKGSQSLLSPFQL